VFVRFHRIQPRENHRLGFLKAGQRFGGRVVGIHDGVADLRVGYCFDVGEQEARFARADSSSQGTGLGDW
jgi:hypothetical protein